VVTKTQARAIARIARRRYGSPILWTGGEEITCPLSADRRDAGYCGGWHRLKVYRLPSDAPPSRYSRGYTVASTAGLERAFIEHLCDGFPFECDALDQLAARPERYR
jgi:hypothetical protein